MLISRKENYFIDSVEGAKVRFTLGLKICLIHGYDVNYLQFCKQWPYIINVNRVVFSAVKIYRSQNKFYVYHLAT